MVDFNEPHKDQQYITLLSSIRDLLKIVSTLIDSKGSDPANKPDYAKRWNDDYDRFEQWNGATWNPMILSIAGGGTGASTASTARTNLSAISSGEVDDKITIHNNTYSVHGAVSTATASRIILRDANGCAKVHAPIDGTDIALLSNVTAHSSLTYQAHGATDQATGSTIMARDSSGKAYVANPTYAGQIANKTYVDTADSAITTAYTAADTTINNAKMRAKFVTDASGYPSCSTTQFTLSTLAAFDTWYSIGPTGGGASYTWTALDLLPASPAPDWIELSGEISYGTTAGYADSLYYGNVYARKNGTSLTATSDTAICGIQTISSASKSVYAKANFCRKVTISSRKFDLNKESGSSLTLNGNIFLTGWGYNPTS